MVSLQYQSSALLHPQLELPSISETDLSPMSQPEQLEFSALMKKERARRRRKRPGNNDSRELLKQIREVNEHQSRIIQRLEENKRSTLRGTTLHSPLKDDDSEAHTVDSSQEHRFVSRIPSFVRNSGSFKYLRESASRIPRPKHLTEVKKSEAKSRKDRLPRVTRASSPSKRAVSLNQEQRQLKSPLVPNKIDYLLEQRRRNRNSFTHMTGVPSLRSNENKPSSIIAYARKIEQISRNREHALKSVSPLNLKAQEIEDTVNMLLIGSIKAKLSLINPS